MNIPVLVKDFLFYQTYNTLAITGGAGTGKTTSVRHIINYLNEKQINYYLLAPTGRAAQNLFNHVSDISDVPAQTIHSFLYEISNDEDVAAEIVKFDVKDFEVEDSAIIIIDEASMLSHTTMRETDYLQFGSGKVGS